MLGKPQYRRLVFVAVRSETANVGQFSVDGVTAHERVQQVGVSEGPTTYGAIEVPCQALYAELYPNMCGVRRR